MYGLCLHKLDLIYGGSYDDGFNEGLKYARTTQWGYLVVEGYEKGEAYIRYDTYGVWAGATVSFFDMRTDVNKKIVIKNVNGAVLYDSGYTNASNLTYTFTSDADAEIYLWSETGVIQYAYYKFTI